jgi:hypothetical protein
MEILRTIPGTERKAHWWSPFKTMDYEIIGKLMFDAPHLGTDDSHWHLMVYGQENTPLFEQLIARIAAELHIKVTGRLVAAHSKVLSR